VLDNRSGAVPPVVTIPRGLTPGLALVPVGWHQKRALGLAAGGAGRGSLDAAPDVASGPAV